LTAPQQIPRRPKGQKRFWGSSPYLVTLIIQVKKIYIAKRAKDSDDEDSEEEERPKKKKAGKR
jgi:hypothetical protein